mmetsp:Transcript_6578/g.11584  ORF Transcript_6578/g.11584 Transcript_6578/m.11584 type:complete len:1162 (-) Transcript_6578:44-3529(-)
MLPSVPGSGFRSQSDAAAVRFSMVEDALLTEIQGSCHKYGMLDYSKASSDGRAHDWRAAWCMLSGARLWHCRAQDSCRCLAYITLDANVKIEAHPENSGSGHVFGVLTGKETHLFKTHSDNDLHQWVYAIMNREKIHRPPVEALDQPQNELEAWRTAHADDFMIDADYDISSATRKSVASDFEVLTESAASFEGLLKTRALREQFERFLEKEHSSEIYVFWTHSEHFSRMYEMKKVALNPKCRKRWRIRLQKQARKIYEDFVQANAPLEISANATVRSEIEKVLGVPRRSVPKDLFEDLQRSSLDELIKSQYIQFVLDSNYKTMLLLTPTKNRKIEKNRPMMRKQRGSQIESLRTARRVDNKLKKESSLRNGLGGIYSSSMPAFSVLKSKSSVSKMEGMWRESNAYSARVSDIQGNRSTTGSRLGSSIVHLPVGRHHRMSVSHAPVKERKVKLQITKPIRLVLDSSLTLVCLTGEEHLDGESISPGWFIESVNGEKMNTPREMHARLADLAEVGDTSAEFTFKEPVFNFEFNIDEHLGFETDQDLEISAVVMEGQAYKCGIKPGWAIMAVNGEKINSIDHWQFKLQTLREAPSGMGPDGAAIGSGGGGGDGKGRRCEIEFVAFTFEFSFQATESVGFLVDDSLQVTHVNGLGQAHEICIQTGWIVVAVNDVLISSRAEYEAAVKQIATDGASSSDGRLDFPILFDVYTDDDKIEGATQWEPKLVSAFATPEDRQPPPKVTFLDAEWWADIEFPDQKMNSIVRQQLPAWCPTHKMSRQDTFRRLSSVEFGPLKLTPELRELQAEEDEEAADSDRERATTVCSSGGSLSMEDDFFVDDMSVPSHMSGMSRQLSRDGNGKKNSTRHTLNHILGRRLSLWDLQGQVEMHGWASCWHREGMEQREGRVETVKKASASDASDLGPPEKENQMTKRYLVLLKSNNKGGELLFFDPVSSACSHVVRMKYVAGLEPAPTMLNALDIVDQYGVAWRLRPEGSHEDEVHDYFTRWLHHLKVTSLLFDLNGNGRSRTTEIIFEGFLAKRGNYNTANRRRWFQLLTTQDGEHLLRYFKEETREIKGTISGFSEVCAESGNSFAVLTPERKFTLTAESDAERKAWMEALCPLLEESRSQPSNSGKTGRGTRMRSPTTSLLSVSSIAGRLRAGSRA